jgi:hypothetical protein
MLNMCRGLGFVISEENGDVTLRRVTLDLNAGNVQSRRSG